MMKSPEARTDQQQPYPSKARSFLAPTAPLQVPDEDELIQLSSDDEAPTVVHTKLQQLGTATQAKGGGKGVATHVMSFDDFMGSIARTKSASLGVRKPARPKPDPHSSLLQAKAEALRREKERQRRKEAILLLQRWYRSTIAPRIRQRLSKLKKIIRKAAIKHIASALSACGEAKRRHNLLLISKYESSCAAIIQRTWRLYSRRKTYLRAQHTLKSRLLALLQAWKTRKIMKSWMLQDCIQRVQAAIGTERSLFVTELKQVFGQEYRCGRWMRAKKQAKSMKFTRNQRQAERIPRKSDNESLPPKRYISPAVLPTEHFDAVSTPSSDTTRTASPTPHSLKSIQPFLHRKSQKNDIKKLDLKSVKTKVSCWTERKPSTRSEQEPEHVARKQAVLNFLKRNSLEEFVALEKRNLALEQRGRYLQKLPIPLSDSQPRSNSQPTSLRHTLLGRMESVRPKVNITKVIVQKVGELTVSLRRLEPKESLSDGEEEEA